MDSWHGDCSLMLGDEDNQTLGTGGDDSVSHRIVRELEDDADPVELNSNEAGGPDDCISTPIVAIKASPVRKVRSAAPSSNGFSEIDQYDETSRPHTVAAPDSPQTRNLKKKHSIKKAIDTKTQRQERPGSADVNGWGDFDTDRLLKDDSPSPEQERGKARLNQVSLDPLDGQRSKSRKSRRSTPVNTSLSPNPWEGYLTTYQSESKDCTRPNLQVLRQKPIEILSLEHLAPSYQSPAREGTSLKPLPGRVTLERLKTTQSRPPTGYMAQAARPTPLFGTEVPDTPENCALIFEKLAPLWSLISYRPLSSSTARSSVNALPGSVGSIPIAHRRSPFECIMTMVKICKTVGISLTPSSATNLSFWYANEQGVDFEAFCDLVIQGAIQPALHHFRMDQSVSEYVSALDTIMQSLFTTTPARSSKDKTPPQGAIQRLRELPEIDPIFPNWKTGISSQLAKNAETACTDPPTSRVTAERVRKAVAASTSQRLLANQLSLEEARVTHVENIRRKVQLHKSWKFVVDGKMTERGVLHSSQSVHMIQGSSTPSAHERIRASGRSQSVASLNATNTQHSAKESFPGETGCPELVHAQTETGDPTDADPVTPEVHRDVTAKSEHVLVCCFCSVRGAELWCSACFTVSCQQCWQEIHSCTVDMSMVATTTKPTLIGPSSLAMKAKHTDRATLSPSVAMVYLPTKAMVAGKLAKGNSAIRNRIPGQTNSNQLSTNALMGPELVDAVVAQAILPSLHKSQSESVMVQHRKYQQVDRATSGKGSSANLMESLSTPTLEYRSNDVPSPIDSVPRTHNRYRREDLRLASVALDAELLLSHGPGRKR